MAGDQPARQLVAVPQRLQPLAMAKGSKLGGMRNAGPYPGSGSRGEQRCLSCKRRIAWGERCESCKRELAARRRRKPR